MIQLRKTPYPIDFVENQPAFLLQRWPSAEDVQLKVWFTITYSDGSTVNTPHMIYDYVGNEVSVGVGFLKHYFKPADVPYNQDGFSPRVVEHNSFSYVMHYIDTVSYGRTRDYVTSSFTMINGYVEPYRWENNFPDWESLHLERFYSRTDVDLWGQNNNDTVHVFRGCEQYIYVRNYRSNPVVPSVTLSILTRTGISMVINPGTGFSNPTIPGNSLVRLETDIAAFGNIGCPAANILQYTVTFMISGESLSRTYILHEPPYNAQHMLFLNNLNLYEMFVIFNMKKELSTSGDRSVRNEMEIYRMSDTERIYTARTGMRPADEIRMLDSALRKTGNMLLNGQWSDYITVVPGTWTITDQKEDLLEVEFQYKIVKRVAREAGTREVGGSSDLTGEFVVGAHARINSNTVIDVRL